MVISVTIILAFIAITVRGGIRGADYDTLDLDNIGKAYVRGGRVPVVANKIGPYNNPAETYSYFSVPYCKPKSGDVHDHQLGEVLSGDRKKSTDYELIFLEDTDFKELCRTTLDKSKIEKFYNCVDRDYYFEFYYTNNS